MRWGSDGNGGGGASAYTLSCRDENASYYYYQAPAVPSTSSAGVCRPGQARGNFHVKKPPDKRQARQCTGSHARPLRPRCELKDASGFTEDVAADRPEEAAGEPEATRRPPLIMCAGRSVYGRNSDVGGFNSRTNQHSIESLGQTQEHTDSNDDGVKYTNRSAMRPVSAARLKRASEPSSPSRYRTDEELEQIIRDLRDQVFHNQQKQELVRQEKSTPATSTNQGKETQKHQRKHLKNPVEKMEGAAAHVPVGASFSAGNGSILQRPLPSSYLSRLVTESTIQMVVPAIINEAPAATSRGGSRTSCHQAELDFRSLSTAVPRSRPSSSSSYRPGERPSTQVAVLNPRSKKLSGKSHLRREMQLERPQPSERFQDRHESLSYSDSFLYLVDVDDSEDVPASLSLSPVGPWGVDEFPSARVATSTSTPRSPSASTCYSLSSFGSDDFDSGEGESSYSELAALSPRSRLLSISGYGEVARATFPQLHHGTFRRSATCGSGLIASTKLEAGAAKPKRCSSAKVTTRSAASGSKQRAATRVNRTRKRPQSGGAARTINTS